MRWCGRSACNPPLLAGVCAAGVCVWARVSAAPRHSWLGCWGVCVCSCACPPCTPHCWLGCAVWVCVFGLGFRLRPATPGWGVGVCVCWCACSSCTPPLLAGVCGLGVCARARVLAAPRHSWLGCLALCVLVCALRLHPANPGSGARCGCVCLGSRSGCAPPLLAGLCVVGVCARARVSAAPRHSWLGCWAVCLLVCALRSHQATPGTGARCGCVCLGSGFGCAPPLLCWSVRCGCVCSGSGFGCAPPLLAGVLGVTLGCVCARVRALFPPSHSWHGCAVCVCVFGLRFRLRPATPGWVVRCGCVCSGSGFGCAPPLLAGVLRCVCAHVRAPLAPRHSWLGCVVCVCVFGLGFWLCPATLLLGCWGVCVLVWALRLHPATPGWHARHGCVCLGLGFGCAPPLLAGVSGCVCAGVGAPLAPRHSWLKCAPWVCVFGLGFRLHPATPGWGVGVCLCWCGRSACTPPLLAGVRAVGVCVWARVSAAPRQSWLGCWAVCVLVWALCLHPATPGWGARRGCVCLGSGFGCTPPLLAGVLGCVCAGAGALFAPRHSWLWCAPWLCLFGLGFLLRPATPGWGVGVGVCWCACSSCTPPFLAGVCGLGVCAWARVSAAPRHSWLGCWAVCVLVCALRLHPATPGTGARCECVCLGSGFGCAPPLQAGLCVVGVCARARVSAAPRHSWLGCWAVCVLVCALRSHQATPGTGARCGCVCLGSGFGCAPPLLCWSVRCGCVCSGSGFGCAPPLLAGVLGVTLGCVCARVRALFPPSHSWHGCAVWVCVFGLGFRLRPATPGWGVRCGCVCSGSGFGCAPPLLAGVLRCVCARVRAPLAPRHSWLGCVVCVCVFGLGFWLCPATLLLGCWGVCVLVWALRLHPATPGWHARHGCVCLGLGFGCAPPLLAGVLGCVCAGVGAPLAPRHSWLKCAPWVCVFGLGFRLHPATPGWGVGVCLCWCGRSACTPPLLAGVRAVGVCVWARVSAAPRQSWLGCWGVCVLVWALLAPCHSWLGCAPWVCVFGLGFRLHPATPGWGVGLCVCWCGRSVCTPPLLAVVRAVAVSVWARVSAAPRHSWLGCWGGCVLVCVLLLYPAFPGWGVRLGCVCLGSGFGCAPPLLAGLLGCVCARVCAPVAPCHSWLGCTVWVCVFGLGFGLRPATPGLGAGLCVCLCAHSACTPPLLAGVRSVGVCVFGLGFWLRPATPGWGVGLCVCLCAHSACTPPILAGVLGVGVCVFGPGFGCAPPLLDRVCGVWVGCCLAPVRVPWLFACCARSPGFWHPAAVTAWHLSMCLGCGWRRASLACLVAPRGVPRLVRSGRSRCSGRLSCRRGAFPHPVGLRPRLYWSAARGTRRPAENRALCACRWPPPRRGRWARSASYPFGAPRWGCPWRVPPALVLGCVRCGGWRVWTRSLTRPVS